MILISSLSLIRIFRIGMNRVLESLYEAENGHEFVIERQTIRRLKDFVQGRENSLVEK